MIKLTTICRKTDTACWAVAATLAILASPFCSAQEQPKQPQLSQPTQSEDDDSQVLMRGPLHEAFASTYQADPQPNEVIDRAPPERINEVPPEFKPEGDNIQWIPGYWAWEEVDSKFIWISGIWRDVPLDQNWISGYWEQTETGHRWISGFWNTVDRDELTYVPTPPASLDQGPTIISPGENYFYCPGSWEYRSNVFVWRAGFWRPRIAQRVWIPACYAWTPRGCVYRTGYWDYEFDARGVVFAPVLFPRPIYQSTGFEYCPSHSIDVGVDIFVHLFVRPNCNQYFYGDWYGMRLGNRHYRPWINHENHHRRYDPLLVHYGGRRHRHDGVQLLGWVNDQHRFYANHHDLRPRTSMRAHQEFERSHRDHPHQDHLRRARLANHHVDRGQKPSGDRSHRKTAAGKPNRPPRKQAQDHLPNVDPDSARRNKDRNKDRERIASTFAKQQRDQVRRAREDRERASRSQKTTEQLRSESQQKQAQRNRDQFMRSQQRKKQSTGIKPNRTGKARAPGGKIGSPRAERPIEKRPPGGPDRSRKPNLKEQEQSRRNKLRIEEQQRKAARDTSDQKRRPEQQANQARDKDRRDARQREQRLQQEKAAQAKAERVRRTQQQADQAREKIKRDVQMAEQRRQQERAARAESDRARRAEQQAKQARDKSRRDAQDRAREQKRQSDQARRAQEAQQRRAVEQQRQQKRRQEQEARKAKRKKKKS